MVPTNTFGRVHPDKSEETMNPPPRLWCGRPARGLLSVSVADTVFLWYVKLRCPLFGSTLSPCCKQKGRPVWTLGINALSPKGPPSHKVQLQGLGRPRPLPGMIKKSPILVLILYPMLVTSWPENNNLKNLHIHHTNAEKNEFEFQPCFRFYF